MASAELRRRRIAIVQRVLPHYRVPFFAALAAQLAQENVDLTVHYGDERPGTVPRTTPVDAAWGSHVRNRYVDIAGNECIFQDVPASLYTADLVIVEQALRLPLTLWLQLRRPFVAQRLALWGHGRNFQAHGKRRLVELFKHRLIAAADWWFAYTEISRDEVTAAGFPPERITVVNNSIDTAALAADLRRLSPTAGVDARAAAGIGRGPLAVYCGGMYPDKRLPFLLDAANRIRRQVADFELVFIGDGPDAGRVREAARELPWIHYLGPLFGMARAPWLATAEVMLMPGLVGLAILDAFVAGLPLVTTAIDFHSPEIAYLQDGRNGVMTPDDPESYANAVAALLQDKPRRIELAQAARAASLYYSVEQMVDRFADGVLNCLARPPVRVSAR